MTKDNIRAAIFEAERFLRAARAHLPEADSVVGTRTGGALRRASLDLTRALADMRKP